MNAHVAIEIGKSSLLLAAAEQRAGSAHATHAGWFDLPANPGPTQVAEALRSALPDVRWGKSKLVLTVGADETQLRRLELPPAPVGELPDMVRLLAAKELGASEGDPLDFLPVHSDDGGNIVIAARLDEAAMNLALGVAEQLDTPLAGVVMRPCASAALIQRLAPETAGGERLVVAPSRSGADLVALRAGTPVLIRSTRGGTPEAVAADIRRTLPAAAQELGGPPESITVLGEPAEATQETTPTGPLAMRVLDLSAAPEIKAALGGVAADQRGLLAGVLGAALDSAAGGPPVIDFANPRQAESGASDRRRERLLAIAAAVAVLLGALSAYSRLAAIERETKEFQAATQRRDKSTETLAPYVSQVSQIERWETTDVGWLDEYETLSRRLRPKDLDAKDYPADEDAYLTELTFRPPAGGGGGGQVDFRATARSRSSPGLLEERLRDDRHAVQPVLAIDRPAAGDYPVEFRTLIRVKRRPAEAGDKQ